MRCVVKFLGYYMSSLTALAVGLIEAFDSLPPSHISANSLTILNLLIRNTLKRIPWCGIHLAFCNVTHVSYKVKQQKVERDAFSSGRRMKGQR